MNPSSHNFLLLFQISRSQNFFILHLQYYFLVRRKTVKTNYNSISVRFQNNDGRTFLPPIRPGWRISEGRLQFSLRWKYEDETLSPTEITRRVIAGSLRGVEKFLKFTTETCEDFETGWLPTLDTSLQSTQTLCF